MTAAGATLGIAGGLVRTGARAIGPPRPNLPAAAARGLGRARRLRAGASTSSATNEARAGEDDGDAPHVPVLMRQVLDAFDGRSLRCYVDGTMGAGGHASAIIRAHPELKDRLMDNARRVYAALDQQGYKVGPEISPVVGVIVQDTEATLNAWRFLLDHGVYVNLVAPPASPGNYCLLRCSLSAGHTDEHIETIVEAFQQLAESGILANELRD